MKVVGGRGSGEWGEVSWAFRHQGIAGRLGVGAGEDPILALSHLRLGCLSPKSWGESLREPPEGSRGDEKIVARGGLKGTRKTPSALFLCQKSRGKPDALAHEAGKNSGVN